MVPQQEKYILKNKTKLQIENNDYELLHEIITVAKAAEIDYKSYNQDRYSTFFEMRNIVDCLDLTLIQDGNIIYSSNTKDNNLGFNFVKAIFEKLKNSLCLSEEEIESFTKECINFLDSEDKNLKMPYELLIANNIHNKTIIISLSDFENMEIKKYEKIQLALQIIKKKVNEASIS